MNRQTIFNTVAKHLLTQNAKSLARSNGTWGFCQYRSTDGMKCAIGVLIPDAEYSPLLENHTVLDPKVINAIRGALDLEAGQRLTEGDQDFLYRVQRLHDSVDTAEWKDALRDLAALYKLSTTVLEGK